MNRNQLAVLFARCPACAAQAGERCKSLAEKPPRFSTLKPHKQRIEAYERFGTPPSSSSGMDSGDAGSTP